MLYELLYTSIASSNPSRKDLTALLEQSRNRNATLDITGCLIFHRGEFMQLLEGPKNAVEAVYADIRKDIRHYRVNTFWEGPIQRRSHSDWSMAFVRTDDYPLERLNGFRELFDTNFSLKTESTLRNTGPKLARRLFHEIAA